MTELPPVTVDPRTVDRAAAEVLARAEYDDLEPGLFDRVWDLVGEYVGRLLAMVFGEGGQSPLGVVVVVALVAALGLLTFWVLRRFRRSGRTDDDVLPGGAGSATWDERLAAHRAAGEYRLALRSRYRLLLARLAEAGVIADAPGRTSGEYLREAVGALPSAREGLVTVTADFEAAWYADATVTEQRLDDFERVAAAVEEQLGRRPVGSAA